MDAPIARTHYVARVAPRLCTSPDAAEHVVAALLGAEVAAADARGPPSPSDMTAFHALEAPAIGVRDYVRRLAAYSFASTTCLLAAVHYVQRAAAADRRLAPSSLSVHRLLITATVLAAKFFDDVTYSMGYYAKVGGLPVKELAYLELRLLAVLRFKLHITPAGFHTLERDLLASLCFVPRPLAADAAAVVSAARIAPIPTFYCECLHTDDVYGLWLPHPAPAAHMLPSFETLASPCSTPPRAASPPQSQHGALTRYPSDASAISVDPHYDDARRTNDEGSGPLSRYASTASTVTSEGSSCTDDSMCSESGFSASPDWADQCMDRFPFHKRAAVVRDEWPSRSRARLDAGAHRDHSRD